MGFPATVEDLFWPEVEAEEEEEEVAVASTSSDRVEEMVAGSVAAMAGEIGRDIILMGKL